MRSEKVSRGSRHLSKSRPNGFEDARRFCAVAGNSQKPPKRLRDSEKVIHYSRHLSKAASTPPEPPKLLRRSKKVFRCSRKLSKAASTPSGAAETARKKGEGFPR